jgi:hypothetical protein
MQLAYKCGILDIGVMVAPNPLAIVYADVGPKGFAQSR